MESTNNETLEYALFSRRKDAAEAKAALDQSSSFDGETVVVAGSRELTYDDVSLGMTRIWTGALHGGLVTAFLGLAVSLIAVGLGGEAVRRQLLAPGGGFWVVMGVSVLFGTLAGALAYSTELRKRLLALRRVVRRYSSGDDSPVVLVARGGESIDDVVSEHEPLQVGTLR